VAHAVEHAIMPATSPGCRKLTGAGARRSSSEAPIEPSTIRHSMSKGTPRCASTSPFAQAAHPPGIDHGVERVGPAVAKAQRPPEQRARSAVWTARSSFVRVLTELVRGIFYAPRFGPF
jgi:hypothetical protein